MKLKLWHYIGIGILALIILLIVFSGQNNYAIETEDAFKGDFNAPVTIIEYSDYECPYCQRFYLQTYPKIKEEYIDKGLVKFVYKDFPLDNHRFAIPAAKAAECSGEQDKYYEMQDLLFEKGVETSDTRYLDYAKELELNINEYKSCLKNSYVKKEVLDDRQEGIDSGISSTPSFLINGELVQGAQPFSVFKEVIDRKLNN